MHPLEGSSHMTEERKDEFLALMQYPTVEVTVGNDQDIAIFNIPQALLSWHSDFFKRAFSGSFRESEEKKASLSKCSPSSFRAFISWMYWGTLPQDMRVKVNTHPGSGTVASQGFVLWVLGDFLQAPVFKDCVLEATYKAGWAFESPLGTLDPSDTFYCWSNTDTNSKLREFGLDLLSLNWTSRQIRDGSEDKAEWQQIFEEHSDLQESLLFGLAGVEVRKKKMKPVSAYLEDPVEKEAIGRSKGEIWRESFIEKWNL